MSLAGLAAAASAFGGLQAHITPADMGPVTKLEVGLRVDTQRQTVPGAFSVTCVDIDPEHQFTLIDANTGIVMEQLGNDGYLGSCFASIGCRNYTFTAWESAPAARPRCTAARTARRCAW
jgi:hypothetical protein